MAVSVVNMENIAAAATVVSGIASESCKASRDSISRDVTPNEIERGKLCVCGKVLAKNTLLCACCARRHRLLCIILLSSPSLSAYIHVL